jgi:hypothetical protein
VSLIYVELWTEPEPVVLPLHNRTWFIRNVAPVVRVEHGASAQLGAS